MQMRKNFINETFGALYTADEVHPAQERRRGVGVV